MPRTQALSFAIRTRRCPPTARVGGRAPPQSGRPLATSARNYASSSTPRARNGMNQSTGSLLTPKPSLLQNAILRRHLSHLSSSSRPQASFLYHNLYKDRSLPAVLARFVKQRYMTTARRKKWKDTLRWQLRFHSYFWPMAGLLYLMYIGYWQIEREHQNPTPVEWSFWARWEGRMAKGILKRIDRRGWGSMYEWGVAGTYLEKLLARLEDPKRDGKGLSEQQDGDGTLMVDGVGKLGYDISAKSQRWRQGYWEALMGLAKVAEHMDGLCKRKGESLTGKMFKWENIPGPQNPRPVPAAWDKDGAHLNVPGVTEVEAAMEEPEHYYLRILTSKGFNNRQRLDAALAYADWCDFKGLKDTSAHVYDWALDIAAGGLPEGADHVVDIQTGVINTGKEQYVSENLLKATTALGVWHARHGEVKEALPIFLSVLKARKALPAAPPHMQLKGSGSKNKAMTAAERERQTGSGIAMDLGGKFVDFFKEADKALLPTSGDEQPFHSLKEACEEVGIMTYIGEILFATSDNEREKGLSWTRDSVEAAEAVLWFMDEQNVGLEQEGRQRCKECLETGLSNWQQMARQMTKLAKKREDDAKQSKGWLSLGLGTGSAIDKAIAEVKKWEEEEVQIELRKQRTASLVDTLKPNGNPFGMNTNFGI
ncbi:hypothetical protein OHC33_002604 [Knufia fluminis]|uniref:Uncharacterized protein n=1 Tax=Knufia fluminis TaxID=191047 RepID=A0AAN8I9Z8_9EURO|nr:hypothetical protein OHC33_002604 [Knufia fluminis]